MSQAENKKKEDENPKRGWVVFMEPGAEKSERGTYEVRTQTSNKPLDKDLENCKRMQVS